MFIAMTIAYLYFTSDDSAGINRRLTYTEFKNMVNKGYASKIIAYNDNTVDMFIKPEYVKEVFKDDYKDIVNKLRVTPYVKDIIPKTINYFETEHYIFVHGWIPCTRLKSWSHYKYNYIPIENWREVGDSQWYEARWINGMLAHSQGVKEEGKTIVCGHFHASWGHLWLEHGDDEEVNEEEITDDPYYADGIIAIDGCTARTGKVNCIVLED